MARGTANRRVVAGNATFDDGSVSALYQGYMDMSYFALFPLALRQHELKVPIVLNYRPLRFEVWLSGKNRAARDRYWELLKDVTWPGYRVIAPRKWADAILEHDLTSNCDLEQPAALTKVIERGTMAFIQEITGVLAQRSSAT